METNNQDNKDATITIHRDTQGSPDGVRVQALGEDFVIALRDLKDNHRKTIKYWSQEDIVHRLHQTGQNTFSRKQALIVSIYINLIDNLLQVAGGKAFATDGHYATIDQHKTEDGYRTAWGFQGGCGSVRRHPTSSMCLRCRTIVNLATASHRQGNNENQ